MNSYKVIRKGYYDTTVTAHEVRFERTHVLFIDSHGEVIDAFQSDSVLRLTKTPIG